MIACRFSSRYLYSQSASPASRLRAERHDPVIAAGRPGAIVSPVLHHPLAQVEEGRAPIGRDHFVADLVGERSLGDGIVVAARTGAGAMGGKGEASVRSEPPEE